MCLLCRYLLHCILATPTILDAECPCTCPVSARVKVEFARIDQMQQMQLRIMTGITFKIYKMLTVNVDVLFMTVFLTLINLLVPYVCDMGMF